MMDIIKMGSPEDFSNFVTAVIHRGAYERLARLGLALTRSGGTLVQASCSARVDVDALSEALSRAARHRGARIREIRRTGHPVDHPIGFRFGGYLKALYVSVLDSGTKN